MRIPRPKVGGAAPGTPPAPLSVELRRAIEERSGKPLTLNQLLEATAGRGPYGLMILLSLPFMVPVSLPGISNVFGAVILYLAWRLALGHPPRLPKRWGDRKFQSGFLTTALNAGVRVLGWIERLVRPRYPAWVLSRAGRQTTAIALGAGGFMLALPLPPTIPLSNFIPAVAVVLLAASIMEEDGVVIWVGYATTIGAAVYLVSMILLHVEILVRLVHPLVDWWKSLNA